MSDDTEDGFSIDLEGTIVTESDLIEFLREKAPLMGCPFCGNDTWSIMMSPGEGQYTHLPTRTVEVADPGKHLPVYGACCDICGFLRLHTYHAVTAWKEQKSEDCGV